MKPRKRRNRTMTPKGMKGRAVVVYLDPEVKEKFQSKVKGEGRKMNTVIAKMVELYVDDKLTIKGW